MQHHVAVAVREHAALVRHAHAAEHDVVAVAEGVDVVTLADADVHVLDPRRSAPGRDLTVAGNAGSRPGALLRALRKDELEPRQVRRRGDLEIVVRSLDQQRAVALALHGRSEEHTSELQSLMRISYAVFCLKKKNHTSNH